MRTSNIAEVQAVSHFETYAQRGIDLIVVPTMGGRRSIKVKADAYCGTDPGKIQDRSLAYYRPETNAFALESVADANTRAPGWMLESDADDLYYYYLALGQEPDEVQALLKEPDEIFFSELKVERDELIVLPMDATRTWFAMHADKYPPRPVFNGGTSSWYRLVPRGDIRAQVTGVRIVGAIFSAVSL